MAATNSTAAAAIRMIIEEMTMEGVVTPVATQVAGVVTLEEEVVTPEEEEVTRGVEVVTPEVEVVTLAAGVVEVMTDRFLDWC